MSQRPVILPVMHSLLLAVLLVLVSTMGTGVAATDAVRSVPQSVADLLTKANQATPAEVVTLITAWTGEPHPLLLLARGRARWRLAQDAAANPGTEHGRLITAAEADFAAALKLDQSLKQAHLGLAQCAADRGDWSAATREIAAGMDLEGADHALMAFFATAALRANDWRLATLATQQGILRFPDDAVLRKLEVAVLVHGGQAEQARQAILALLAHDPVDVDLWRQLAWSAHETGRTDETLGALEAALALKPADPLVRRQLAEAQLSQGLPQAALVTVTPLIGDPPRAEALADYHLMQLASRAAADGGALNQARSWLSAVPEVKRSRELRLAAARYAVQAGDMKDAGAALDALVAGGERDTAVLVWAASLAETRGEVSRAETLYLQAIGSDKPAISGAALRLTALYLAQNRHDEARTVLASYLANHPDDVHARALEAQLARAHLPSVH
jgi:predicted Zn-dependent protease